MATLADVFQELNALKSDGVVREYAIGGATAALFYAEPSRTFDVDVFVTLPEAQTRLTSLQPIYDWASRRGFAAEAEHVLVHGVPVQFLPAHNAFAADAVATARALDYRGVSVRVISPEYLIAPALQVGGPRQRERVWQPLDSGQVDREELQRILTAHNMNVTIDDGRKE